MTNNREIPDSLTNAPAHVIKVTPPILTAWLSHLTPREPILEKYPDMDSVFGMFDRAMETFQERRNEKEQYEFIMDRSEAIAFYNAIEDYNDTLLVQASS